MSFLDRFRKAKRDTAADIQALLDAVEAAIPEAQKALDTMEIDRAAQLLDLSDQELAAMDQKIATAEREWRDLDHVRAGLATKLADARRGEMLAAMQDRAALAKVAVDDQTGLLIKAGPLLEQLVKLATEFRQLEAERTQMNAELVEAGFAELKVKSVWTKAAAGGWQAIAKLSQHDFSFPGVFVAHSARHGNIAAAGKALKG